MAIMWRSVAFGIVLPPAILALWIAAVRVNNRYFRKVAEPDPWLTLFKLYCVAVFWIVMDFYVK